MKLNLTGHHIDITESLRNYVETKLAKLERHFGHDNNIHVVLTVEKAQQVAEAKVHFMGNEFFATAEDHDMYAAIDALVDKLARQLDKHKEKLMKH